MTVPIQSPLIHHVTPMHDGVTIVLFFIMLFSPCIVAMRSLRPEESAALIALFRAACAHWFRRVYWNVLQRT